MSVHSDLVADAVWPADIRTAITLTGGVYVGQRPQRVTRQPDEVLIERLDVARGAVVGDMHRYRLHVRTAGRWDGDATGRSRRDRVEDYLRTLVSRYDGTRPTLISAALSTLVAMAAIEESPPEDALDDPDVTTGTVAVSLLVYS